MNYFKHKTSIIDENCIIGENTKIWHWTHISKNTEIGRDCTIGQNVFIGESVKIGNNVKIQNNVSVYQGVFLDDDVFCGPSVVFTNVKFPQSRFKTEKKNYSETIIKKGVTLGANSTIVCGITINENAFIGAGAVITKDINRNTIAVGNPAYEIGKICNCKIKVFKKPYNFAKCENCNFKLKSI
tara:strand:- start:754 stop:1305 length:552 start_codon:yes stop_codon:yes gene_type:complete